MQCSFGRLVFKTAVASWRLCRLHFPEHVFVGIETVVSRAKSHDGNLLPPVKEEEQVSKLVFYGTRPVNRCGYIRAIRKRKWADNERYPNVFTDPSYT